MSGIRLVLDTNVYIMQALKPEGILATLLINMAVDKTVRFYTSPDILVELQHKLEDKFALTPSQANAFINDIEAYSSVVRPTTRLNIVKDPDDNKVLECALEAKAHLIISADKDLLKLKSYKTIRVAHPSMLKYWFSSPPRKQT